MPRHNGGDGSTRVNLRGLGTARTLVLLDGRRVVPSGLGADRSVDLGTIPLAMIERVEVLEDGASAIYGSDAIAGVVNVITRTDIHGIEANVYTSTSNNTDGTNYDLSLVGGYSWHHGNITVSGGYQDQGAVMARDRDFSRQTYSYDYTCTSAMQQAGDCIQAGLTGSAASPGGRINTSPSNGPPVNIPGCNTKYCTADGKGGFRNFVLPSGSSLGDAYNFETAELPGDTVDADRPVLERPLRHHPERPRVLRGPGQPPHVDPAVRRGSGGARAVRHADLGGQHL